MNINYKIWGKKGDLVMILQKKSEIQPYVDKITSITHLENFQLISASQVQHYCGDRQALNVMHLRFEPNIREGSMGGAHISATIELGSKKLIGFVRMLPQLDTVNFVSHQNALHTTLHFLRREAADLITSNKAIPNLDILPNGSRIEFPVPYITYDQVQFRWIGAHSELLFKINKTVSGMKVKMYLPAIKLWCWAIVDKNNEVMVFERDISWDFQSMRRDTQMWLHDIWLTENHISLPEITAA